MRMICESGMNQLIPALLFSSEIAVILCFESPSTYALLCVVQICMQNGAVNAKQTVWKLYTVV